MKFLIDKIKLKLLLEQKRDYIGHSIEGIDMVIAAITFMISLICSDFRTIFGINEYVIETLAWVIAIAILVYGIHQIYKSSKLRYNHEILFHDIENLNEVIHAFSIIAIKDTFNTFPNRYLLYYDKAWECWFFFSIKTSEYDNENFIREKLSNMIKVDSQKIILKYISARIQPKYSERDKIQKVYQHSLYLGEIVDFSDLLKNDTFDIDGVSFKWWTLEELESDDNILQKNSDVISYIKEKIS